MVLAEETHHGRQTRRRSPKVKTGCKTCKIRRVKCDETKPSCNSSTGRKCDGYTPTNESFKVQVWSHSHESSPYNATTAFTDFGDNVRYLEFYHRCARPSLSSHFDNDFWSKIVLQMAHSEPAVRHALIALGFLCQTEPGSMKHARAKFEVDDDYRFVLSHYNKSVRALVQRMSNAYQALEVALVTCLLFVCMEFLRGNYHTAFTHMKNGLSIITERRRQHTIARVSSPPEGCANSDETVTASNTNLTEPMSEEYLKRDYVAAPHPVTFHEFPRPTRNSTTLMETTLVPMFIRGISSALLYGVKTTENLDVLAPMPSLLHQDSFADITEAHQACHELRNSAILHLRTMGQKSIHCRPPSEEDRQRRGRILEYHRAWFTKVEALERTSVNSEEERVAMSSIKMSLEATFILTGCSLDARERECDNYLDRFEQILHHARIIMQHRTQNATSGPLFTFEICIIPPLFIVATRCRCPVTRRAAVAILEQKPPREGLWDAQQHVLVSKRAIEIEEQDLDLATGWPTEQARLTSCVSSADMDRTGGFWVSFLPARWLGQLDGEGKQKILQEFLHV